MPSCIHSVIAQGQSSEENAQRLLIRLGEQPLMIKVFAHHHPAS